MMVASTMVPPATFSPREARWSFTRSNRAFAQIVPLQQVTEVQDRRLVRHRLATEVDADEPPHGQRVIQRLLRRRVRQIEPVLQEVHPQHPLQPDRRAAVAGLGVERLDQRAQFAPRHHLLHLGQECRPPRQLAVLARSSPSPGSVAASQPTPPLRLIHYRSIRDRVERHLFRGSLNQARDNCRPCERQEDNNGMRSPSY